MRGVERLGGFAALLLLAGCAAGGADEPSVEALNQQAAAACDAGDDDACDLLATSLFLAARAGHTSLAPSLAPFQRACALDDWHGCAMAATVAAARPAEVAAAATKAFTLAQVACDTDEHASACTYLGDWAARAGDRAAARASYGVGCRIHQRSAGARALAEYTCTRAIDFGAQPGELAGPEPKPSRASDPSREARRIRGPKDIQPHPVERRRMCALGFKEVRAQLVLCLSDAGVPSRVYFSTYSGARAWDRRLFETMRRWRYTPFIGPGGQPEPVCTEVTFIFTPRC